MVGGAYLCFEGFEKLAHKFLHGPAETEAEHAEQIQALSDPAVDLVALEKEKIRGAIRTDFILSAEIIAIALGIVAAFIQESLDHRVYAPRDIEENLKLPVLASVSKAD